MVAASVVAAAGLLVGVGTAATPLMTGVKAPLAEGTPCVATVRACVDLDGEQAWLLDGGEIVRGPVEIVTGDTDDPTPKGRFTVQWKAAQYTSREYLVAMPWSVFFAPGGIAFHYGDPSSPSAGCVKLSMDNAHAFFQFLNVGDPVQVV